MDRSTYLSVKETLSSLESSYKDLDITSQITQLNALIKVCPSSFLASDSSALQNVIERRQKRLLLCLNVVTYEESLWETKISECSNLITSHACV